MSRRIVGAILLGTLLNPLNSSMIAVALVTLGDDFDVSLATVTWLITAFYLAAAVGQPLMGRLADIVGPKRVFCAGWVLVALAGALAPLAPAFGWLVAARVVLALGTSTAFPAGLALLRRAARDDRPPATALGALSVAASVSAAVGPVLGGGLVVLAGWEGIFVVNVVLALVGLPLALHVLPADPPGRPLRGRRILDVVDLPGIALFVAALGGLLGLLLSLGGDPRWWLAPVAVAGAVGLGWRERRAAVPLLDLTVALDRRLLAVFAQFAAINVVFYTAFFGLPQWLQEVRGYSPGSAGLLLLPVAGLGVLVTPLAARWIDRRGPRPAIIAGSVALAAGSAAVFALNAAAPVAVLLGVGALLGIPNGLNNLGLQTALYADAPPASTGAAGGLFQTSRYVGAIAGTALIGVLLGDPATTAGLHDVAVVALAISLALVAASVRLRTRRS